MPFLLLLVLLFRLAPVRSSSPQQPEQQQQPPVAVAVGGSVGTVASSFVAHGWEPWMATQAFSLFDDPAVVTAFGHLRGQTIRFGGITADWLEYVMDRTISAPCTWGQGGRTPFTPDGMCPFSTGAFDALRRFLDRAGVGLLFDLNVLVGRNCTQPEPHQHPDLVTAGKGVPNEWCGDNPLPWNTSAVRVLLQHVFGNSNRTGSLARNRFVGFELGNELFAPRHITPQTAAGDIAIAADLLRSVWVAGEGSPLPPPRMFATGTNDCQHRNNSDTMAALLPSKLGMRSGFSWHSYPGNAQTSWNKSDLTSFLLNASWLRHEIISRTAPCLHAWNSGPRAAGVLAAVTEAAAMCGYNAIPPGKPTTSSFIHGFFSVAQLGQFAREGIALLARWGIPQLLGLDRRKSHPAHGMPWDPASVASDLFLYVLYNRTVGRRVLKVSGDENSDALVYAHCSKLGNNNGSVTLMAANPSATSVKLSLSLPTRPRLEYVLTAPHGDLAAHTPVLNGNVAQPLQLATDGSLPRMPALFCAAHGGACEEVITLPSQSWAFVVLLGARSSACIEDQHALSRGVPAKTDDAAGMRILSSDGSKLQQASEMLPTAITCEQAGLTCVVGGGALADSELGLTEVVHIGPERRKIFIGSPSMWKLPNGTVLASHDYFTNCKSYPKCWEDRSQHNATTGAFIYTANGTLGQRVQVLRDDSGRGDHGSRWRPAASVPGMYWATLWAPPAAPAGDVYLTGVSYGTQKDMSIGRSIVIARSTDYGSSFSEPAVLFPGSARYGYSGAPTPNLVGSDGRIYRAFEASAGEKLLVMTKAPFRTSSNLLDPQSWEMVGKPLRWNATERLPDSFVCPVTARHPTPRGKTCFNSIQEGGAVEVNGTIYDVLRLDGQNNATHSKAIVLKLVVDQTSRLSSMEFVQAIDFPSTSSKFTIRQEPASFGATSDKGARRFFAITNLVTPMAVDYADQNGVTGGNMALGLGVDAVGARNVLVLATSTDAVNGEWVVCDTLLYDDSGLEYVDSVRLTGFQYVDWIFDGADILYIVRTSYRGANTYHNANRLTVKRIHNYTTMCSWRESWRTVGKGWCRPTTNFTARPPQLSDRACAELCTEAGPSSCKGWANGAGCVLYPDAPTSSSHQAPGTSDPAFKCHRLKTM
eukprot:COSAG01_NODE_3641_length_5838_cov_3.651333_2_plen_1151_part_00